MRPLILLLLLTSLLPLRAQLSVHPNPFREKALITYTIAGADTVSLSILDVSGKIAVTAFSTQAVTAGIHTDTLDLTASPDGLYYARLTHFDGTLHIIKLMKSSDVSIAAHEPQLPLSVFPNPSLAGQELYILTSDNTSATFLITDVIGKTVSEGRISLRADAAASINVRALTEGIYLLRVVAGNRESRFKVIRE